ncbi:FAD:protein FMN transferase [Psychroflexus salinarum]|uniref:FAD:protein FMN transferase n=1 Tax=Psychroflexus salinarum TaxID=546024 RepID=A0ABW3GRH2_9FLAO
MRSKILITAFCLIGISVQSQSIFKRDLGLMGSKFDITVVANSKEEANTYIDEAVEEIQRIENLISSWKFTSQTSKINRNAGLKPVKVDCELFQLIQRSINISKITDGAFDISFAAIYKIWNFNGEDIEIPDQDKISASVEAIGYEHIVLNEVNSTVFLSKKDMKIGFGAIGKGYAADKAKQLLIDNGVVSGIINASGDMNTWGVQPNGKPWKVAITNPMDKSKSYGLFDLENRAVVTSGNYEKFTLIDGERYSHIIDPRTGMPTKGILSVTVFAPKAELADALATSVFVMGTDIGLHIINQIPEVETIIVKSDGSLATSTHLNISSK